METKNTPKRREAKSTGKSLDMNFTNTAAIYTRKSTFETGVNASLPLLNLSQPEKQLEGDLGVAVVEHFSENHGPETIGGILQRRILRQLALISRVSVAEPK